MDDIETMSAPARTETPAAGAKAADGSLQDALRQAERSAHGSAAPRDPLGGGGPPSKGRPSRGGPPKAPAANTAATTAPTPAAGELSLRDRLSGLFTPGSAAAPPATATPGSAPGKAAPAKLPGVAPTAAGPKSTAAPTPAAGELSLRDRLSGLFTPGSAAPPVAKGAPPAKGVAAKGEPPGAAPSLKDQFDGLVKRLFSGKSADKAPAASPPGLAPAGDGGTGVPVDSGDADAQASSGGMSQFVWYGAKGAELDYGAVVEVMQTLYDELGVGTGVDVNNSPDAKELKNKDLNPISGYWWFNKDDHQVYSGSDGGVKYIKNLVSHHSKLNGPLTQWLGKNGPGSRPGHMVLQKGVSVTFYDEPLLKKEPKPTKATKKKGVSAEAEEKKSPVELSTEVPGKLQNLDAANTPSRESCFDTVDAMLLQNGDLGIEKVGFQTVTSETYKSDKDRAAIDEVEADVAALSGALDYLEFETSRGMKVKVGVTNCKTDYNEGITDHWVLVDRMVKAGSFHFLNPSATSTAAVNSKKNVLTSNGETMTGAGYTVSVVKINTASKKKYAEYKAKKESGGEAPAPEKPKEAPAP